MFSWLFRFLGTCLILLSGTLTATTFFQRETSSMSFLSSFSFFFSFYYLSLFFGMFLLGVLIHLTPWTTSFDLGVCSQSFFVLGFLEKLLIAGAVLKATLAAGSLMHLMAYFVNLRTIVENLSPYHAAFFSAVCILFISFATHFFLEGSNSMPHEEKKDLWASLIVLFLKTFTQTCLVFLLLIPFTKGFFIDVFSQKLFYYWPIYLSFGAGMLSLSFSKFLFINKDGSGGFWKSVTEWGHALSGWILLIGALFFARSFTETVYFPSTVWSLCFTSCLVSFCLFCSRKFFNRIVSWSWIVMAFLILLAFFVLERHELFVQNIGIHPVQEQFGLVFS